MVGLHWYKDEYIDIIYENIFFDQKVVFSSGNIFGGNEKGPVGPGRCACQDSGTKGKPVAAEALGRGKQVWSSRACTAARSRTGLCAGEEWGGDPLLAARRLGRGESRGARWEMTSELCRGAGRKASPVPLGHPLYEVLAETSAAQPGTLESKSTNKVRRLDFMMSKVSLFPF